jgi:hypothetical protein
MAITLLGDEIGRIEFDVIASLLEWRLLPVRHARVAEQSADGRRHAGPARTSSITSASSEASPTVTGRFGAKQASTSAKSDRFRESV